MKIKSLHLGVAVVLPGSRTLAFIDAEKDRLEIKFEQGIFWIRDNSPAREKDPLRCVTVQNVRSFVPYPPEVKENPKK